jgi:hypothetical protein
MVVEFVLCRLVQAFSSIEMLEKVGNEAIVVGATNR